MPTLGTTLVVAGVIFPALSWMTAASALWTSWRTNRHSSPIFIPFVGPLLLTCYILVEGRSRWMVPAVWALDIGTLAFLWVLPRLAMELWNTSSFTRIMTLRGTSGIQNAVITLHTTGHYMLKKSWDRQEGESGIARLGEPGTFCADGDAFELVSHSGLRRRLVRADDQSFLVEEHQGGQAAPTDYDPSLHRWLLKS
jgi:hypothetical protein